MTEGPLRLQVIGIAIDLDTGEQQPVNYRYRCAADETAAMEIEAFGRTTVHQLGKTRSPGVRTLHERLFGGGSGGDRRGPADLINIDGTPHRPRMADRWLARWERIESTAAD